MINKYLIVIVITMVSFVTGYINSSSDIEKYLDSGTIIDSMAKDFMPVLDDLPKYESIEYKYTHKPMIIFQADSVALIVKYDDNIFESEKKKIDETYTFLNEETEHNYYVPEYEFSVESYDFRIVNEEDKSKMGFPKSFGMIGVSEEKKSIAYLYFYDFDLDIIGGENEKNPMENFVKEYFRYDF